MERMHQRDSGLQVFLADLESPPQRRVLMLRQQVQMVVNDANRERARLEIRIELEELKTQAFRQGSRPDPHRVERLNLGDDLLDTNAYDAGAGIGMRFMY